MTAAPATARNESLQQWSTLAARCPRLASTMRSYLEQQALTLAPRTIYAADGALRGFGLWLADHDPAVVGAADIGRSHIEAFKIHCHTTTTSTGKSLATNSIRQRLRLLKVFFDRIIEWDWTDAPPRNPIIHGDVPARPEPMPKFLDDDAMAAFLHHATTEQDPLRRLVVLLLARTGMRVSELCNLPPDPVAVMSGHHWLHVPVGKLRTDRLVPLQPELVEQITAWQTDQAVFIARHQRLFADQVGALNRDRASRMVRRIAKAAGVGHVHPHQLRHTLATQAINQGMRLENIAAMLGHKSLEMTLVYARIANRTVADEYFAVTAKVDGLYQARQPATVEGPNMRRLHDEHRRMLANGWCDRPANTDCHYETICETCSFYATDPTHVPVLIRQRDHATEHGQTGRAEIYNQLIEEQQP